MTNVDQKRLDNISASAIKTRLFDHKPEKKQLVLSTTDGAKMFRRD